VAAHQDVEVGDRLPRHGEEYAGCVLLQVSVRGEPFQFMARDRSERSVLREPIDEV